MYNIESALERQILEQSRVRPTVIFTEPTDPRILEAVCHLVRFVRPVLLASEATIRSIAAKELRHVEANSLEYALSESAFIIPQDNPQLIEEFAADYLAFCQKEGLEVSLAEAKELVSQQGLFGIMAVRLGHADSVVGGAVHRPRQFYRPMAKLLCRHGFCAEAGVFVLPDSHPADYYPHNIVVFGDVGVNSTVTPEILAKTAVGTCMIARDIIPEDLQQTIRGVLVSYSHNGSDEGPSPERVREATAMLQAFLAKRCERDARYKSIQIKGEVKASVALSARSASFHEKDGAFWEGAPSAIICPNLEMGNMLYHLYSTSYPEARHFTVMFGLGNRAVSLARDCEVDNVVLGVKASILRLLRFDEFVPSQKDTFFRHPLVLAINPGSTTTKIAVFRDEEQIFAEEVRHPAEEMKNFEGQPLFNQFQYRTDAIEKTLAANNVKLSDLAAIAARGGLLAPISHGTYEIGSAMLAELKECKWGEHACNLGAAIADMMGKEVNIPSYIVDPVVVDELPERVRITGRKEMRRRSVSHALNQMAIARRYAEEHETFYERINVIVAHLGGGISVGAHRHGRYIDVNNALDGEGPFTPERAGSLPMGPVVNLCFSGKTKAEVQRMFKGQGGLVSLLGTADLREVEKRVLAGETEAVNVLDAMAYRIAKEITSLLPAFEGEALDQVLLTGGMARCKPLVNSITKYVAGLRVGVSVYPGENEMIALAKGVLRVLLGKEKSLTYTAH